MRSIAWAIVVLAGTVVLAAGVDEHGRWKTDAGRLDMAVGVVGFVGLVARSFRDD